MNLNNMNDDFSDSGYMNRNFETNLDEIFENLNYFLTTEKKRIIIKNTIPIQIFLTFFFIFYPIYLNMFLIIIA